VIHGCPQQALYGGIIENFWLLLINCGFLERYGVLNGVLTANAPGKEGVEPFNVVIDSNRGLTWFSVYKWSEIIWPQVANQSLAVQSV
jgi:hypothetical protein